MHGGTTIGAARAFSCPACGAAFDPLSACGACGAALPQVAGVPDFLADRERDALSRTVESFYDVRPFPGYAPGEDAAALIDRSRRSPFVRALDRALPPDALVLECGCGTAQLSAYLALSASARTVVAVDACRASLREAELFRARAGLANLHLGRADLFALPVRRGAFHWVISRGVVHHTPDPFGAIRAVARHVAPGGTLVLGFYESLARLPHRGRRALGRLLGRPARWLDPVLRRADLDEEKKLTWIEDQYLHPLEHLLALPRVLAVLRDEGFAWVRTVPPVPAEDAIFRASAEPGGAGLLARRLGWLASGLGDEDAGLVCVIVRRA